MKILVCISSVPDTTSKINFSEDGKSFDAEGVQYVINPHDEFALTKAMHLKESNSCVVDVINVGTSKSDSVLRKTLAIGADKAIRIDTEAKDGFFVAKQIANYLKDNPYDLILSGKESLDYNGGMVPGMLSALLGYDFVNGCIGLELSDDKVTLQREIDGGKETLKASLPLIVAGQKGLVEEKELKIPNMRGIMMARKKPLEVIAATDMDASTKTVSYETLPAKGTCKLIDADNVAELVELLHNEAKVI
ncbi:MAG: electron transfer flavoprotein subunit beta/FixA family protein [Flavobacteriaceae bacterium]|nr:electron transfer flavoprotein subunit beta/FixA family protein [Flavobacteriaceae bacterium]